MEWDQRLAVRIGESVKAKRQARGWTAARLSEETKALGYPMHRVAIGKLENGHRGAKFDVSELIVLAKSLDVAPVELMFPGLPDGEVEHLPGNTMRALDALKDFTGEGGFGTRDHNLALMRALENLKSAARKLKAEAARADPEKAAQIATKLESINGKIEYARQGLLNAGYTIAGPEPKYEPIDLSWLDQFRDEDSDDGDQA